METALLILIALGAGVYLYFALFKKKGCNCGSNDCGSKKAK
jgi:hypothetical protein